jgi:hypothetical protein
MFWDFFASMRSPGDKESAWEVHQRSHDDGPLRIVW